MTTCHVSTSPRDSATFWLDNPKVKRSIAAIAAGDEDLAQALRLHVLDRYSNPRHTISYVVQGLNWHAGHLRRSKACYDRYVEQEPITITDEGDVIGAFDEVFAAPGKSPEAVAEARELQAALAAALARLPACQLPVARLMIDGHGAGEIARATGKSPSNVAHMLGRIRRQLGASLARFV